MGKRIYLPHIILDKVEAYFTNRKFSYSELLNALQRTFIRNLSQETELDLVAIYEKVISELEVSKLQRAFNSKDPMGISYDEKSKDIEEHKPYLADILCLFGYKTDLDGVLKIEDLNKETLQYAHSKRRVYKILKEQGALQNLEQVRKIELHDGQEIKISQLEGLQQEDVGGHLESPCIPSLEIIVGELTSDNIIDGKITEPEPRTEIQEPVLENSINKSFAETEPQREIIEPLLPVPSMSKNFKFINKEYWETLKIAAEAEKDTLLPRYYTHTNSRLIAKAVAISDFIVEPPETFLVRDDDGRDNRKTFSEILNYASSQRFSLIKILAEGGVGKSTFLYWIAKQYYAEFYTFYIKRADEEVVKEIIVFCEVVEKISPRPFILIIDDAIEVADNLPKFISDIQERISFLNQFIFIIAERDTRYNMQFGSGAIEREFCGCVQTVTYTPPNKEVLFDRIYFYLQKSNEQLSDETIKERSKNTFLNKKISSISESLFRLLDELKLHKDIDYKFDWEVWENFIETHNRFEPLRYLFVAVACFYKFGIRLRITFKSSSLKIVTRELILEALESFDSENGPILLTEDRGFLFLKHEYVASWYIEKKIYEGLVQGFFRDFINSVDNIDSAKLIRKVRKILNLTEFKNSFLSKDLPPEKYLEVVDKYLNNTHIDSKERVKMLNEKGIILLRLARIDDAISIFELSKKEYPLENHARDQLAKYYSKNENTYQAAIDLYFEIIANHGYYAIIPIKKLLAHARDKNIQLRFAGESDFSPEIQHLLIVEFIKNNELQFAEDLIAKVKNFSKDTADCCNRLAKTFVFSEETIEKKKTYYELAYRFYPMSEPGHRKILYRLDYAVFLFRIREFAKSNDAIKQFISEATTVEQAVMLYHYEIWIKSTTKIFLKEIPTHQNVDAFNAFFLKQSKDAAALINFKATNPRTILQGYSLLQAIRYNCKTANQGIFSRALVQLAYCHMVHTDKNWNNFSVIENRLVAENYYRQAVLEGAILSNNDWQDRIRNLLSFKDKSKFLEAHIICEKLISKTEYKNVPSFYRFRGNAKRFLGNYKGAMEDYCLSLKYLETFIHESVKDFNNDMTYLFSNMSNLICDCVEKNVLIKQYKIEIAELYAKKVFQYRKDFGMSQETFSRIDTLKISTKKS